MAGEGKADVPEEPSPFHRGMGLQRVKTSDPEWEECLRALDAWALKQTPPMKRSAAIQFVVKDWLISNA